MAEHNQRQSRNFYLRGPILSGGYNFESFAADSCSSACKNFSTDIFSDANLGIFADIFNLPVKAKKALNLQAIDLLLHLLSNYTAAPIKSNI